MTEGSTDRTGTSTASVRCPRASTIRSVAAPIASSWPMRDRFVTSSPSTSANRASTAGCATSSNACCTNALTSRRCSSIRQIERRVDRDVPQAVIDARRERQVVRDRERPRDRALDVGGHPERRRRDVPAMARGLDDQLAVQRLLGELAEGADRLVALHAADVDTADGHAREDPVGGRCVIAVGGEGRPGGHDRQHPERHGGDHPSPAPPMPRACQRPGPRSLVAAIPRRLPRDTSSYPARQASRPDPLSTELPPGPRSRARPRRSRTRRDRASRTRPPGRRFPMWPSPRPRPRARPAGTPPGPPR